MMEEKIDLIIAMLRFMKNNINDVEHEIKTAISDHDQIENGFDIRFNNIRDRLDQSSKDIQNLSKTQYKIMKQKML